jgi:hypothetical protein
MATGTTVDADAGIVHVVTTIATSAKVNNEVSVLKRCTEFLLSAVRYSS